MRLLSEGLGLLRIQASEAEHADLFDDVAPVTWGLEVVRQLAVQCITHADDPVGHVLDFTLPLTVQGHVTEDGSSDPSTMQRWVGVHRTDDNLDLRSDTLGFFRR